jgi:hypothetical protein
MLIHSIEWDAIHGVGLGIANQLSWFIIGYSDEGSIPTDWCLKLLAK